MQVHCPQEAEQGKSKSNPKHNNIYAKLMIGLVLTCNLISIYHATVEP